MAKSRAQMMVTERGGLGGLLGRFSSESWRHAPIFSVKGLAAIIFGSALVAAAAHISVPLSPIPMTLQTLAVMMVGMMLGGRLGCAALLAYLLEGAVGLPVFAPIGAPGALRLVSPTAGYLWATPLLAAWAGFAVARFADHGKKPLMTFLLLLVGSAGLLSLGSAWLALFVGPAKAVAAGFAPFIVIEAVKAGLAAALFVAPSYFTRLRPKAK